LSVELGGVVHERIHGQLADLRPEPEGLELVNLRALHVSRLALGTDVGAARLHIASNRCGVPQAPAAQLLR